LNITTFRDYRKNQKLRLRRRYSSFTARQGRLNWGRRLRAGGNTGIVGRPGSGRTLIERHSSGTTGLGKQLPRLGLEDGHELAEGNVAAELGVFFGGEPAFAMLIGQDWL
jgi:hypothetical protein